MIRSIGALMVSRFEYDVDAAAFISAAGITVQTQKNAINSLVVAAKTNGWWSLCNAIYPIVGGTATTHKYNLKDPQDTDAAFRLNFQGTWVHSATGADPDGSTAYADTFLVPSTVLTLDDNHISVYSRTDMGDSTNASDIGSLDGSRLHTIYCRTFDKFYCDNQSDGANGRIQPANTDSRGHFLNSRISSTSLVAYVNGISIGSGVTNANSFTTRSLYISAINSSGTAAQFSTRELAFSTIGAGISDAMAATMYTDIQAFQTSLARNV